jgi:hypothetical protein
MLTSRELNNPTDDFEWKYVEVSFEDVPIDLALGAKWPFRT